MGKKAISNTSCQRPLLSCLDLLGNNVASTNAQGQQNQSICCDFKSFPRRQPDSFTNHTILKDYWPATECTNLLLSGGVLHLQVSPQMPWSQVPVGWHVASWQWETLLGMVMAPHTPSLSLHRLLGLLTACPDASQLRQWDLSFFAPSGQLAPGLSRRAGKSHDRAQTLPSLYQAVFLGISLQWRYWPPLQLSYVTCFFLSTWMLQFWPGCGCPSVSPQTKYRLENEPVWNASSWAPDTFPRYQL